MGNRLAGSLPDPSADAGYPAGHPPRVGFFTDTSVCIGCKACEVACKEWNDLPADGAGADVDVLELTGQSYDNTGALGASTYRHVAFVEQKQSGGTPPDSPPTASTAFGGLSDPPARAPVVDLGMPSNSGQSPAGSEVRWLMSSDVCKHCTHAACLDVCPTGALIRTEHGTVLVQQDVCNGCGYCIPACPYGVIDQRPGDGRAFKCTMCHDRLGAGLMPACATACPTESIQFGPLDELRERADERLRVLQQRGETGARLYGHDPDDGVGGDGAFFLLLDEPEAYGLPPDPVVTTRDLPSMWRHAAAAALTVAATVAAGFLRRPR
jgi:formate dehydrogenase iron-sulfur subunit